MGARAQRGKLPGSTDLFIAAWRYTEGDRYRLLFAHIISAVASALKVSFPILVGAIINGMQGKGLKQESKVIECAEMLAVLLLALWLVRVPLKLLQFGVARRGQNRMITELNRLLFSAPLAWHESQHSGDTAARQQQSSSALYHFLLDHYSGVELIIQIIGPVIALAILSPPVLAGALIGCAIVAFISVTGDRLQVPLWMREADAHRTFGTAMVDGYRNIMTVYATRRQRILLTRLGNSLQNLFAISRRNVGFSEGKAAAIEAVSTGLNLGLVVLYIYLNVRSNSVGRIALGNVYMVQAYVMAGTASVLGLVTTISATMRYKADFAAARTIYVIDPEPTILDTLPLRWSVASLRGLELTYRIGEKRTAALQSASVTLNRGSHYALVGANGSGKSTLLKLLAGLIRPDRGTLTIDDVPFDVTVLRNAATLIPQHPELLEGTIGENLLVDGSNESLVARIASCDIVRELLEQLNVTLDSKVQEAGVNWSGGQRQRIALARGILSATGSSLVLVDEPTSSIDPADEREIVRSLRREFSGACLLISIHNLELAHEFDGVIVLEHGKVKDSGSPDLVCARCDYFADSRRDPSQQQTVA